MTRPQALAAGFDGLPPVATEAGCAVDRQASMAGRHRHGNDKQGDIMEI
ncbi:MAG: hypothetical protein ACRYG5_01925 [Janthinobacterium lividum]